jgi:hypothetical protein
MKTNTVTFDSAGPSGNIYSILAEVRTVMREQRRITEYNDMRDEVFKSQSYAAALKVIREHINLIDVRGRD